MESRRAINSAVLARLISSAGAEAGFFIGLWGKAAFEFDGTPTDLAILGGAIGVSAMIGSVIGGVLVDRFDAKRVVIGAELLFAPVTLTLIAASNLTLLISLGAVTWLLGAILETGIASLPPALVDDEGLDKANARLEMANWLALIIGPALGGIMFPFTGFAGVFILDAASSLVAAGLVLAIRMPEGHRPAEAPEELSSAGPLDPVVRSKLSRGVADFVAGLRRANRSPGVRLALYLTALPAMAFGMFIALEPLFYRDVVGSGVEVLGYVNVVFGAGLFAGSLLIERTGARFVTFRHAVMFVVASGLGSVLYTVTGDLRVVLLGAVTWSVPLGAALPLLRTLAQRAAPKDFVGRVTGLIGTVDSAAGLLPIVIAPVLADRLGVQPPLVASGLIAAVFAPVVWRTARALDEGDSVGPLEPAQPAPQQTTE